MQKNWLIISVISVFIVSIGLSSSLNFFGSSYLSRLIQEDKKNTNRLELEITDLSGNVIKELNLSKGELFSASINSKGNLEEKLEIEIESNDYYNQYAIQKNTDKKTPDIFTIEANAIGSFYYKFIAKNGYGAEVQKTITINIVPGLSPHGAAEYNCDFSDTESELVQEFCQAGVIKGYSDGTFRPENAINRAELVKVIYELFGDSQELKNLERLVRNNSLHPFKDVPADHWANPYISLGKLSGNITGYENGQFEGHKELTRSEAWKIITDAAVSVDQTSFEIYNDIQSEIARTEPWFETYYSFAKTINMDIAKKNNEATWKFMSEKINRMEVLEFLHNLFQAIYLKSQ